MKKIFALLISITLLLSLCACNQGSEDISSSGADVNSSDASETSSSQDASSEEDASFDGSLEGTVSESSEPEESEPEESKPEELTTLNPKTNIEMDIDKEYIGNKYSPYDENSIEAHGVSFTEECVILLSPIFVLEDGYEEIPEGRAPLIYNDTEYYRIGAGQTPYYYEITDTEIILKNCFWDEEEIISAKMVLLSDGTLKVTFSSIEQFSVGDILSLEWSYLD